MTSIPTASAIPTLNEFSAAIRNVQTMLTDRDCLGASLALVEVEKLAALASWQEAPFPALWAFRTEAATLCGLVREGDTAGAGAAIRKMERFISPPVQVAAQAVPSSVPHVSARIDERQILEVAARLGSRSLHVTRAHEIGGKTRTIMEEAGLIEFARALSALTPSQSVDERVHELEDLLRTTLACLEEAGCSLPDGFGRNGRLFGWLRDALAGAAPGAIQIKLINNQVEGFGEDIPNGTYRLLPDSTLPTDPAKEKHA